MMSPFSTWSMASKSVSDSSENLELICRTSSARVPTVPATALFSRAICPLIPLTAELRPPRSGEATMLVLASMVPLPSPVWSMSTLPLTLTLVPPSGVGFTSTLGSPLTFVSEDVLPEPLILVFTSALTFTFPASSTAVST